MSETPIKKPVDASKLAQARDLLSDVSRRLHVVRLATVAADEGQDSIWGDFLSDVDTVYQDITRDVDKARDLVDRTELSARKPQKPDSPDGAA